MVSVFSLRFFKVPQKKFFDRTRGPGQELGPDRQDQGGIYVDEAKVLFLWKITLPETDLKNAGFSNRNISFSKGLFSGGYVTFRVV